MTRLNPNAHASDRLRSEPQNQLLITLHNRAPLFIKEGGRNLLSQPPNQVKYSSEASYEYAE
jgi:hypothetical protein